MTAIGQSENQFDQEYIRFLLIKYLRNWLWFVLSVVVCLGTMFAYLTTLKYSYNSRASILIRDEEGASPEKQDLMEELNIFGAHKRVDNEVEIIKSYKLAEKVVDDLNLTVNFSVRDQLRLKDIYNEVPISVRVIQPLEGAYNKGFDVTVTARQAVIGGVACPFGKAVQSPLGLVMVQKKDSVQKAYKTFTVSLARREEVIKSLVKNLQISQPNKNASVLYLTIEDTAPDRGVAYLNRLIYFYELMSLQDKNRAAASTLRFVEDRLVLISKELTTVETDIERFKTNSGIVDLTAESSVFLEKVKENDSQLSQVAIQLGTLAEIQTYLTGKTGTQTVAPSTLGLESPTLTTLINGLFELEAQRGKLIRTVPEKSVPIETLDDQIGATKRNILDNVMTLRKILLATQQSLQGNNRRIESTIRTIPGKERALLDISRQSSIKGNLYNYLLQKREEAALSFASAVSDMRVVDDARSEPNPVRPIRRNFLLFALVLGLILPVTALWLVDFFNSRINRKSQIEQATKTPIIGEVILADNITSPLEVTAKSRSLLSEQIRALRTNIQFLNPDGDGKHTILITSSISGEGKSFISLNLGASLAIADKRVVLLELDMRKPKMHRYLKDDSKVGLSSYLAGQATLDEIIKPVADYPNLFFIPCGILPPNPSELIGGEKMRYLFENLHEHFDVIIVDTPPVGLVTDASILAKYGTMTLYIVRHLVTSKSFLKNID
ncbi:MAG TPA: polysaccharide biosynthesis tyrosine autokinase, partial [Fibrella sp.]